MEKNDIEDYINKLKRIEKNLSDDESFDLKYIAELDTLLNKLRNDVTETQQDISVGDKDPISYFTTVVKFKKLDDSAVAPKYSKEGDAGLDLTATSIISNTTNQVTYGTGIALEIPNGFVGLVFPRSSIKKYELQLSNSVGIIDSGYRGEIQITFNKIHSSLTDYKVGDRVAQIIILPYPQITMVESKELSKTERGEGGFGSTGT